MGAYPFWRYFFASPHRIRLRPSLFSLSPKESFPLHSLVLFAADCNISLQLKLGDVYAIKIKKQGGFAAKNILGTVMQ